MTDNTLPTEDLYVVGRVRPVHLEIPLQGEQYAPCRGHAQTSYAGHRLRLLCWPEQRFSPKEIVVGTRDCFLNMELCGTPLRVAGGILKVIRRERPILLLKIRDYVYLDQKRQSFRAPIQFPVLCWTLDQNNKPVAPKSVAQSINISGEGILLWGRDTWKVGQLLRLELELAGEFSPVHCTARVLRSERDVTYGVTALQWENISEAEREAIVSLCFAKQREEIDTLKKGVAD